MRPDPNADRALQPRRRAASRHPAWGQAPGCDTVAPWLHAGEEVALTMLRTRLAVVLSAAVGLLTLSPRLAHAGEPFRMISVEDVAKGLDQPGFHVFDANGRPMYDQGHVPRAVHVSYKSLTEKEL